MPTTYTVSLNTPSPAATVQKVAHPDAGYVALQRGDGLYLSLDPTNGNLKWEASAGAWERFQDGGNCWVAPRDGGKTFMLAKGAVSA